MKKAMSKVYLWLFIGLLVTFTTGFLVSQNPVMVTNIFTGYTRYILIIAELGIAIFLGARIFKMSQSTATCLYLLYTFLTGLTLSIIFLVYNLSSLLFIILVASCLFGAFALIGKIIKIDLSKISVFLIMGLIGVIVLGIINIFLQSTMLQTVGSIVGLLVFLGYTCYDMQRIDSMIKSNMPEGKIAILGAFSLYIDYINILMDLLNLFGDRRK
jgi:hypothetical protein